MLGQFKPVAYEPFGRRRSRWHLPPWLVLLLGGIAAGALGLAMVTGMTLLGPTAFGGHEWWDLTWNLGVLRALPAFGVGVTLYGIRHHLARIPFAGEAMYVVFFGTIVGALVGLSQGLLMILIYGAAFFAAAADMRGESGLATTSLALRFALQ